MKTKTYLFTATAASIIIVLLFLYKFPSIFNTNNPESVKIYYADNISNAHQKIISIFNQEYAGKIEIIAIDLPFSKFTTNERKEILARSLRSKTDRMDIFAIDLIWGPRFAKWAFDLSPYFNEKILTSYTDHALVSCRYEDELISLPFYTDVGVMYYRKDILDQAGITAVEIEKINSSVSWQEFIEIGRRVKKLGYPIYLFSGDSFEGMICAFHETLNEKQSDEIFKDDDVHLNNEAAVLGLSFMVDLIHKYKFAPIQILEFDENKSKMFALENNAAFLRGWPGFFKNAEEMKGYEEKIKHIKMAPLPHFKGQEHNAVYGGWNLMISKYSKNKQQALEFVKFATSIKMQKIFYEEMGYFPIRKEIYADSAFMNKYTELNYYQDLFKRGRHRPFKENYTKISDIMSHYFHKALEGEISPEVALERANEKINSKRVFLR